MKALGIIPARYASTRFPGKPLAMIGGKSMIQRVYEQASKSNTLSGLVVATDDKRIEKEVLKFGGRCIMTGRQHRSGTDRCLEALETLEREKPANRWQVVVNIQGDEPFIHPDQIDKVVNCFMPSANKDKGRNDAGKVDISTLVCKIEEPRDLQQPAMVKVVRSANGLALYFSRSPIPYLRENTGKPWTQKHIYWKHIGIYAFRASILRQVVKLQPSPLEIAESLEQLRWLENGYSIRLEETDRETIAIDTPEDLKKIF